MLAKQSPTLGYWTLSNGQWIAFQRSRITYFVGSRDMLLGDMDVYIEIYMDDDVNGDGKRARTFQGPGAAAGPDSEGPLSLLPLLVPACYGCNTPLVLRY